MNETGTVEGEDDVIPFVLSIIPTNINQGIVELSAPGGSSKIKVWTGSTKGTQITLPKRWDLSEGETVPSTLYVEGVEKSGNERDVRLRLKYTNTTEEITQDEIKITVVNLKLGYAVYREKVWENLYISYNHSGLIGEYIGTRSLHDITDFSNYVVYDMQRTGMRITSLDTFTTENPPCYGAGTTDYVRTHPNVKNKILKTLKYLYSCGIQYPSEIPPYAIEVAGVPPLNTGFRYSLDDISHLRCDGLVEVCYEYNNAMVWGWNSQYYDILLYLENHNDRPDLTEDPYTELSPKAQRGGFLNDSTNLYIEYPGGNYPYEPWTLHIP